MHAPPAVSTALVTGSIVVALYCTASLALRGRSLSRGPLAEANHVVMALAMVVMLVPATMGLVPPVAGLAGFAALALAWLGVALRRRGRGGGACGAAPLHLVLVNAAMAAMYAAMLPSATTAEPLAPSTPMAGMPGMETMPGMAAASTPPAAVVAALLGLGIVLFVHAAWSVGGAVTGGAVAPGGGMLMRVAESPRAHRSCQALMSVVMGAALLLTP